MSLGFLVASDGQILGDDAHGCIIEARIEQQLDEAASFAIRFIEDFEGGRPRAARSPALAPDRRLSIAVVVGESLRCLVHGVLEGTRSELTIGGPGSWHEVRGRDQRVELALECRTEALEGTATEKVERVLRDQGIEPRVDETVRQYEEARGTLNQANTTDLELIERIASENNLSFWLTYDCQARGEQLDVSVVGHLRQSPPVGEGGSNIVQLRADTELVLRPIADGERCRTMTRFEVRTDSARPARVHAMTSDLADGERDPIDVGDPNEAIDEGPDLSSRQRLARSTCVSAPGDGAAVRARAESVAAESAWFVTATASTTAHLLGGVVVPHDTIRVEGVGPEHSGVYQVKEVTHVLNATGHFMDLVLRRNRLGQDNGG